MKLRSLLALPFLAWISACDRSAGTNDETTTSVARIYLPDGKPAVGARALLYPAGDTTQIPSGQAFVANDGSVTLPAVTKGWYNVVITDPNGRAVLIDSLLSTGGSPSVPSDTLRNTATVIGQIVVQPQHSAQIAWVQLPGAGVYANVDTVGRFRLNGIPAGKLTLAALTREAQYTNAFVSFRTFPDSTIDLGKISLPFTGLPVVQGIRIRYDSLEGVLHVSWNRVQAHGLKGYVIDGLPNIGFIADTSLADSYFSPYDSGAQSDGWFDTTAKKVSFSVRVQDSTEALGPKWEQQNLTLRSMYTAQRGKWTWTSLSKTPIPTKFSLSLDTIAGQLVAWSPGDSGNTWNLWISNDGLSWSQFWKNQNALGLPVAAQGFLWHLERTNPINGVPGLASLLVIRQNLTLKTTFIDTITTSDSTLSGYITFRHDSVVVSPANRMPVPFGFGDRCIDYIHPIVSESWIRGPGGIFRRLQDRAFSTISAAHARATLRDLVDEIDWWMTEPIDDSCGAEISMTMPQLEGGSIALTTTAGDTVHLRTHFPGGIIEALGSWGDQGRIHIYQQGVLLANSLGLSRWILSDPNHPWTTSFPFNGTPASNAITPWKNGIATVSQDGQLWFATLSGEK